MTNNQQKRVKSVLYIEQVSDLLGGGQISLLSLLKNINIEKWRPVVIIKDRGSFAEKIQSLGIPVYYINFTTLTGFGFLKIPYYFIKLIQIIKAERIDIIHISPPRLVLISGIIAKFLKIPLIWHVRISDSTPLLDRINLILANKIIVNSRATSLRFYFASLKSKITVIYNGIDFLSLKVARSREMILSELGIGARKIIIGNVSRFSKEKDHITLIRAFENLSQKFLNLHLLFIGNTPTQCQGYKKSINDYIAERGFSDRITMTDYKEGVADYINLFDFFVLPSRSESFGRVLVEALYLSKPVVATNVGGIPEIIENNRNGILVPVADVEKMTEAISFLLENDKIARDLGMNGTKMVTEKFSIEEHVRKIEDIYGEFIEN